jgi:hypothetical protein
VIASIKMSGNRLGSIIVNDCMPMLTKLCSQTSSSFSNIKHATSTARDAVDKMGGGAHEMVLDIVIRFWCRNDGGRIYKITGFAFGNPARKRAIL